MNNRPINTLEEDFAALGLVEMGRGESPMDPRHMAPGKKKGKKGAPMPPHHKPGMGMEDMDLQGDESIEELRLVRRKKLRGAKAAQSHRAAKLYRQKHAAQIRRAAKKPAAIRRRKRLAKMPAAPRGKMRMLSHVELSNLGDSIRSLGENTNTAALQKAFVNVYRYAKSVCEGYGDLIDQGYMSRYVSYPDMIESSNYIAQDAHIFAKALAEHDGYLKVADQELLKSKVEEMAAHMDEVAEVLSDTKTAIAIVEGTFDPDIHDEWLAYDLGIPLDEGDDFMDDDLGEAADQKYGEAPLTPIAGWGNDPDELTFNVMHPLGITRAGQREKVILAKQLPKERNEDEDIDGLELDEDDFGLDEDDDLSLDDFDEDLIAEAKRRKKKKGKWEKGSQGDTGRFVTDADGERIFFDKKYAKKSAAPKF